MQEGRRAGTESGRGGCERDEGGGAGSDLGVDQAGLGTGKGRGGEVMGRLKRVVGSSSGFCKRCHLIMLSQLHLNKHKNTTTIQPTRNVHSSSFPPDSSTLPSICWTRPTNTSHRRVTNKTTATAMMTTPRKLANPIAQYLAHRISAYKSIKTLRSVSYSGKETRRI